MTLTCRRPGPGDGVKMSNLMADWIAQTPWMPNVHSAEAAAGFGDWLCRVADVQILRVGSEFAGFYAFQDDVLQAFYLMPDHRGKGVGSEIMAQIQMDKPKIVLWTFQANKAAQRFYMRFGFVEVERTDGAGNDENLPDIKYEWRRKA